MSLKQYKLIHILRAVVIIAAAVCIFIGLNRGEAAIVLRKAIHICLECIGV